MVDQIRAMRLLSRVTSNVDMLEREAARKDQGREQATWLPGVKYLLQTAIEGCVDVAHHICAASGLGIPNDNGEAMTFLLRHGVIDEHVEKAMRQAVGLRNVLVHEYVGVDDEIVLARINDLSDLKSFVRQVIEWIPRTSA